MFISLSGNTQRGVVQLARNTLRCQSTQAPSGLDSRLNLSPLEQYDKDVKEGKIRNDEHQRKVLGNLNSVYEELLCYNRRNAVDAERKRSGGGFFSRLLGASTRMSTEIGPKGIYMYGDVGCGKTMLMDMFYRTVPRTLTKRRLHFHAFMQDMHKLIHKFSAEDSASREDAVIRATHHVATEVDVLCLDEVAVIDVADAMILRHVWDVMYADGMTTFMTSNREPEELYKNGVQRQSFLPAIDLINERNHIVFLDSPTDYRKLPRPESGTYFFDSLYTGAEPLEEAKKNHVDRWFEHFAEGEPAVTDRHLNIWGRPIPIPRSAGNNVMQFTFNELCGENKSAADYLEICRNFPTAIITDIPSISMDQRDLIRRFITFLDAAYDSHCKLVVTAEKPFDQLFNTKDLRINPKTNKVELVGNDGGPVKVDLTNFAGHEEMFAFARALSRLKQMSSAEWLDFER